MRITEIMQISLQSIQGNKLRTLLTVLGVVVGIFSIIVIMTIITMLQNSIENGLSALSQNTFQIQKFPIFRSHGPGEWAKYRNRKDITLEQFERLSAKLTDAAEVGGEQKNGGVVVKYGNEQTNPNIMLYGETVGGIITNNWKKILIMCVCSAKILLINFFPTSIRLARLLE